MLLLLKPEELVSDQVRTPWFAPGQRRSCRQTQEFDELAAPHATTRGTRFLGLGAVVRAWHGAEWNPRQGVAEPHHLGVEVQLAHEAGAEQPTVPIAGRYSADQARGLLIVV